MSVINMTMLSMTALSLNKTTVLLFRAGMVSGSKDHNLNASWPMAGPQYTFRLLLKLIIVIGYATQCERIIDKIPVGVHGDLQLCVEQPAGRHSYGGTEMPTIFGLYNSFHYMKPSSELKRKIYNTTSDAYTTFFTTSQDTSVCVAAAQMTCELHLITYSA